MNIPYRLIFCRVDIRLILLTRDPLIERCSGGRREGLLEKPSFTHTRTPVGIFGEGEAVFTQLPFVNTG